MEKLRNDVCTILMHKKELIIATYNFIQAMNTADDGHNVLLACAFLGMQQAGILDEVSEGVQKLVSEWEEILKEEDN